MTQPQPCFCKVIVRLAQWRGIITLFVLDFPCSIDYTKMPEKTTNFRHPQGTDRHAVNQTLRYTSLFCHLLHPALAWLLEVTALQ